MTHSSTGVTEMSGIRAVAMLTVVSLVWTPLVSATEQVRTGLTPRQWLEARRAAGTGVSVELLDGSTVSGAIARAEPAACYVVGQDASAAGLVAYEDMRALVDLASGERFEVRPPITTSGQPRQRASLKALLIVGAVVGGLIVLASWIGRGL